SSGPAPMTTPPRAAATGEPGAASSSTPGWKRQSRYTGCRYHPRPRVTTTSAVGGARGRPRSPAAARPDPDADTAVVRRSRGPLSEPVSGLDAGRAAPAASPTGCSFTSAAACTGPRSAAADLTTASGAVSAPPARAPRPSPPTAGGAAEG